jgi:methylenetetrahydrofolate dehydrogenase (NADP+)/methenyltetrahydrofolate cyclohydrolase
MKWLSGVPVCEEILNGIKEGLSGPLKRAPCLVFLLVGDHGPSKSYVSMKAKACDRVGIISRVITLDQEVCYVVLKDLIIDLNNDENVDGIIIQMPLPKGLEKLPLMIDPSKDVDGFTPKNMGKLVLEDFTGFIPCTPQGIFYLLRYYNLSCDNKHVVIMGRSHIVGKPLVNLLSSRIKGANATVTCVHSGTKDVKSITKMADILIVAIGQAGLIDASYIKKGACVIDVGINRIDGKIVGDCNADSLQGVASCLSPVPGGVGPMTIACLLLNTYLSYKEKFKTIGSSKLVFEDHLLLRN